MTPQENYLNETFGLEDAHLNRVKAEIETGGVGHMSVMASEARILQFLIRGFGVKRVIEFGTLFGYSALAMAQALPDDGYVVTLEKDPKNFAVAKKNFEESAVGGKVKPLNGDAVETMRMAENSGPYDMAFIDANKSGYVDYLNWAEKFVRRGGLIVGDNTFLFGALWGEPRNPNTNEKQILIMKTFNLRLSDSSKYNSILIPTQEGMTVAQKLF